MDEANEQRRGVDLIRLLVGDEFVVNNLHGVVPVRNSRIMLPVHFPDELDQRREIDLITGLFRRDVRRIVEIF